MSSLFNSILIFTLFTSLSRCGQGWSYCLVFRWFALPSPVGRRLWSVLKATVSLSKQAVPLQPEGLTDGVWNWIIWEQHVAAAGISGARSDAVVCCVLFLLIAQSYVRENYPVAAGRGCLWRTEKEKCSVCLWPDLFGWDLGVSGNQMPNVGSQRANAFRPHGHHLHSAAGLWFYQVLHSALLLWKVT